MKNILIDVEVNEEGLKHLKSLSGVNIEMSGPNNGEEFKWLPPELIGDKHIFFGPMPPKNLEDAASLELIQINCVGFSRAGASLMQNVHCAFACANTVILETPAAYGPMHSEIIRDSFVMEDGMVLPPDSPGLGIVLTDETKNKYPFIPETGEFIEVPGKVLINELSFK